MAIELTDKISAEIEAPEKGAKITYDSGVKGFGLRVTSTGTRSFILNYRTRSGLERRYTIGGFPAWKTRAARKEAEEIKIKIRANGYDPLAELKAERDAPTMSKLCEAFVEEILPSKRDSTRREYKSLIDDVILEEWRHRKVEDITAEDVDALHRKITRKGTKNGRGRPAPYRANRTVAVLSRIFNLAIRRKMRTDNPCRGVERNQEDKRQRYLRPEEMDALVSALAAHKDREAANAIRLLLLTGARKGEVLGAKWSDLDLGLGIWTKPGATTKQKTLHRVPLSAPARQLLSEMKTKADAKAKAKAEKDATFKPSEFVFPGRLGGHRLDLKKDWRDVCIAAGIVTTSNERGPKGDEIVVVTPSARIHDLRHSFASYLASAGQSLPIIGALLGHTQASTTQRYAHLLDDPLRLATERIGALVAGNREHTAEVHQIDGRRA